MADEFISISELNLIDRFPGPVNPNLGIPTNGWDNTVDNFVTTAEDTPPPSYPIGTKIQAYTDNSCCPGYYTMAYLAYHCVSSAVGLIEQDDFSIGKAYCSHYDGSEAVYSYEDATLVTPYFVMVSCENDVKASDITRGGTLAIPCCSMSAGESESAYVSGYGDSFGWFWVGGVCPVNDITTYKGEADVTTGVGMDLTADGHLIAGPFVMTFATDSGQPNFAGMSLALDTTDIETGLPYGCAVGYACTSCRT